MYPYFDQVKKTNGMLNLREASVKLGQDNEYLSRKRSVGEWPKGIKLYRKRTALYMNEDVLPVLRQFYGVSNDD
jgi:hypothetical protein